MQSNHRKRQMVRSVSYNCFTATSVAWGVALSFCFAITLTVDAQGGGNFEIPQNVIANGGGESLGRGGLGVAGTVAQPAAGNDMSGGSFPQASGFWPAGVAVAAINLIKLTNGSNNDSPPGPS